jgi:hypothetical protein
MYALIENGEITRYNIQLPTVVGNTSIPAGATGLEAFGLYPIVGDEPSYAERQRIAGPQYQFDGTQVNRVFTVEAIPDEEKAGQVRSERNALLASCDWTQLADAPVNTQAWSNYRQALRDISTQAGFPWDIQWPEAPAA